MKILFDNGTPKPIARSLVGHNVTFAGRTGWHELKNGELIRKAEEAGYEVLLSTDKNCGGFSRSIRSEKTENLAPRNFKGNAIDGIGLRF